MAFKKVEAIAEYLGFYVIPTFSIEAFFKWAIKILLYKRHIKLSLLLNTEWEILRTGF